MPTHTIARATPTEYIVKRNTDVARPTGNDARR